MNIIKLISKKNCYIGQSQAYIVIHETDNWSKGADAKAHANAMKNGNLAGTVHYYVDSKSVYQTFGPQRRGLGSRGRKRKVWNHEPEFYQYRNLCESGNRLLYGGRQDRTAGGSFAETVRMGDRPAEKTLRCVKKTLPETPHG